MDIFEFIYETLRFVALNFPCILLMGAVMVMVIILSLERYLGLMVWVEDLIYKLLIRISGKNLAKKFRKSNIVPTLLDVLFFGAVYFILFRKELVKGNIYAIIGLVAGLVVWVVVTNE